MALNYGGTHFTVESERGAESKIHLKTLCMGVLGQRTSEVEPTFEKKFYHLKQLLVVIV